MRVMNTPPVKTRFAPSPTGRLHAGNLRTALFNWLLARRHAGAFMLRIEDSDSQRNDPTAIDAIRADLQWLGLAWDEGPGAGAPSDWQQSARASVYAEAAERLIAAEAAYPCFCSATRLAALRDRQRRAGQPPRYDGHCAGLDPVQSAKRRAAGEPAVLRLRMPESGKIEFHDLVRGAQSVRAGELGDPVILRADGSAAFLFANALDDALMGITHVLRGEDHLSNTPRQQVLLRHLGLPVPAYGHLALLVDTEGAPLSKRRGDASIAGLREAGYRPEALLNYLARLGNPVPDDSLKAAAELASDFDPATLSRSPARFDHQQLDHWQAMAMAAAPVESLRPALEPGRVPVDREADFLALVQPNLRFAAELNDWAGRFFDTADVLSDDAMVALREAGPAFFETVATALESADTGDWKQLRPALEAATGRRGGAMMKPLRLALTGLGRGPALGAIIDLMPADIRRARLQRAAAVAASGVEPDA